MVDTEPLKITYNLSHCYLEVARGSMTTIHHQNGSLDKFLSGHAPEPLANAILSLVSITVIYSYLTIESFVNYQLFRLWEMRHDGSQGAKNFLQELGDPEEFEKLKYHSKVRRLGGRLKTLCVLLGYPKPHEAIPRTWQHFNDLVEISRHFFVHPHPEKEFFQNNLSRIGMQTKAGEYVKVAEEILSFLYAQSGKQPPAWVNCNTLLEFKGIDLL